ncbi:MAG: DUF3137 domain-containing protein [Dysgonomonas sp.]
MNEDSLLAGREERLASIRNKLSDELSYLEDMRIDVRHRQRNFIFVLIAGIALSIFLFTTLPYLIVVVIIALIIFYYFYVSTAKRELNDRFSKDIAPTIISEFFPEASYEGASHIHPSHYWQSQLFKHSVDSYDGKNLFNGTFGQTQIRFSQLHTQYKTETRDKNGNTHTTWHTIFDGVFLVADCNKNFDGKTFVLPDSAEKAFGRIGKFIQEKVGSMGKGELVYMENPLFEKQFVVYASDPVEARYLLTPSMQQHYVDLWKHIEKEKLYISYIGGKIYMAISGNFNFFDTKTSMSFTETNALEYYAKDLLHILSVIEIMNLNVRIWGK